MPPLRLRLRYYDLCCLLAPSLSLRRPFRHKARSPQVRTSSFPARPPDLRSLSFDHRGFVATGTLATLGAASYPVLVHRPAVSLPASSPRLVALSQLQFASFGMVSFRGDFHPQDDVHAGRTRSAAGTPPSRSVDVTPSPLRRPRQSATACSTALTRLDVEREITLPLLYLLKSPPRGWFLCFQANVWCSYPQASQLPVHSPWRLHFDGQ